MAPYWGIQSYGYPNPVGTTSSAWTIFEILAASADYEGVKLLLGSGDAAVTVDRHTTESWKAAFESFGLMWVRGANEIVVTPGGHQYLEAAEAQDQEAMAWIALNLLLRCPLGGPRGNWQRGIHSASDLLPYWALLAAMLDLDGQLWIDEVARLFFRTTGREGVRAAVQTARELRAAPDALAHHPYPAAQLSGDLYNRVNQALLHIGVARILTEPKNDPLYVPHGGKRRVDRLLGGWRAELVETAMGGASGVCGSAAPWTERIPASHLPEELDDRFAILGAAVPDQPQGAAALASGELDFGSAWLVDPETFPVEDLSVLGPVGAFCVVAPGDRVVLRGVSHHTYRVGDKELTDGQVRLRLYEALRITDAAAIAAAFQEAYGD